ncbi:hypothetical protein AZE42_02926 [Rhizopogon vesiculosus]|uniref:Uncharacterized protein n=1 Tax=Rhizopogon vesiculosus TaxID=180088 RepID=A0A1J8PVI3_9AGAM|nr:hypothetical protein AZE42_02926 [Rhizopogon vesiculosus]
MSEKKGPTKRRSRATVKAEEGGDEPNLPQPTTITSSSPRKRKAANPPPRELFAPITHMQDLHPSRDNRQSELVPVPPHILERQRARRVPPIHPSDPPYRRPPADMRSARRPSVSTIAPRPPRSRRSSMPDSERNMLQRELQLLIPDCNAAHTSVTSSASDAWHTVMTTDPLVDSDEECHDGHVRTDYVKRMQVISRLRGRPPTPEGESNHMPLQ